MRSKKSALVWSEILRLFLNTFTPDDKCSRRYMKKLQQQFETPLSEKEKTVSRLFIAFLKWAWNLEHFRKRDEYPSLILSEIIDAKGRGYLNV